MAIRVSQVADLVAALHDLGVDDIVGVVKSRSGSGFDPDIAEVFVTNAPDLLAELDTTSRWEASKSLICKMAVAPRRELEPRTTSKPTFLTNAAIQAPSRLALISAAPCR